jgi:hypothetical protein
MDFIQPIGPDRDLDPVLRVERAKDEQKKHEQERKQRKPAPPEGPRTADRGPQEDVPTGPVEGDDGHLHIDIRA